MASAAPDQKRAKMVSPVDEIVEVTQCDPALAQAVLDNVTDDVSSPVSCALHFSPPNLTSATLSPPHYARSPCHHLIEFAGATSYIVDSRQSGCDACSIYVQYRYMPASFCLCTGIEVPRRAHHASPSHSSHQSNVPPDFSRHDRHELPFRRSSRDHPSSLKGAHEMETELRA